MSSATQSTAVTSDSKRESFAVPNLTWIFGIVAAICVLTKIYSVAGFSTEGALLILRSTNLLSVAIGMLGSGLQFTSFAILLFVAALYMQAEWPVRGRHEREVNILAIAVVVCAFMVIVVGAWPLGTLTVMAATSYLARRVNPVRYLGRHGVLGGRIRRRLLDQESDQESRAAFRTSLSAPVLDAVEDGDLVRALSLLSNPPSFAEEELGGLIRRYDPKTGVGSAQRKLMRVALALICAALFSLMASPQPWVPPEQLVLTNGTIRTGYVIGDQGDSKVVLWRKDRKINVVRNDDLKSRSICQTQKPYPTALNRLGLADLSTYMRCP
jgi:hypothetical protein